MKTHYTRKNLKRLLLNTVNKVKLLTSTTTSLTKKQERELLANQTVVNSLNKALEIFDTNYDKSCQLICEIPYKIVNPHPEHNFEKNPIVGSDEVYRRTDKLRHYIRMIPDEAGNLVVPNNVMIFRG